MLSYLNLSLGKFIYVDLSSNLLNKFDVPADQNSKCLHHSKKKEFELNGIVATTGWQPNANAQ